MDSDCKHDAESDCDSPEPSKISDCDSEITEVFPKMIALRDSIVGRKNHLSPFLPLHGEKKRVFCEKLRNEEAIALLPDTWDIMLVGLFLFKNPWLYEFDERLLPFKKWKELLNQNSNWRVKNGVALLNISKEKDKPDEKTQICLKWEDDPRRDSFKCVLLKWREAVLKAAPEYIVDVVIRYEERMVTLYYSDEESKDAAIIITRPFVSIFESDSECVFRYEKFEMPSLF